MTIINQLRGHKVKSKVMLGVIAGFIFGLYKEQHLEGAQGNLCQESVTTETVSQRDLVKPFNNIEKISPDKRFILTGVLTSKKYLSTRAKACYETWARYVPGTVLFFSSEGSEKVAPADLPVIGLRGVDDAYPPQKKSLLMLKYMHKYYANKYTWFIRADDDSFIKGDKLEQFLKSINSSKTLYIGHFGLGNKDERGKLNIRDDQPYCTGGPTMIFSRSALNSFAPNISYCLSNLLSYHEDVEVGRCVTTFANVSCTQSVEAATLFYQNYGELKGSFEKHLRNVDVQMAITLHPIKNHTYHYHIHAYFKKQEAQNLRHRAVLLEQESNSIQDVLSDNRHLNLRSSLLAFIPNSHADVIPWDFFSKHFISFKRMNPNTKIDENLKTAFRHIKKTIQSNFKNRMNKKQWKYKQFLYALMQVDQLHGVNYIVNSLLETGNKTLKERRRNAQHRDYLHQPFSRIEFRESIATENKIQQRKKQVQDAQIDIPLSVANQNKSVNISHFKYRPFTDSSMQARRNLSDIVLHFIMTLSGRFDIFLTFITNFENEVLRHEKRTILSLMLFQQAGTNLSSNVNLTIQQKQRQYPQHELDVILINDSFSRGLGLGKGSLLHSQDALLVFIDVDMFLHQDTLLRIKLNTIQGRQAYFPIVFTQYDHSVGILNKNEDITSSPLNYSDTSGFWRSFGYGIASVYNSDLRDIGGFNMSIKGWGKEDINVFESFIKNDFTLFRAADPGLVHMFHPKYCDSTLDSTQYNMGLGSKANIFASILTLSKLVYENKKIMNRLKESEQN